MLLTSLVVATFGLIAIDCCVVLITGRILYGTTTALEAQSIKQDLRDRLKPLQDLALRHEVALYEKTPGKTRHLQPVNGN